MVKINKKFPLDLQEKLREIETVMEKRQGFLEPEDRQRALKDAIDVIIEQYLELLGAMPERKVFK